MMKAMDGVVAAAVGITVNIAVTVTDRALACRD